MVRLFVDPQMFAPDAVIIAVAVIGLLVALLVEVNTGRIPNAINYALMTAAFGVARWDERWEDHLLGLGIAATLALIGYARGWVPAGIAKLAIGIGLLAGPLPACSGLLLVVLAWPVQVWLVNRRDEAQLRSEDCVHCSPQFVAGSIAAFWLALALGVP